MSYMATTDCTCPNCKPPKEPFNDAEGMKLSLRLTRDQEMRYKRLPKNKRRALAPMLRKQLDECLKQIEPGKKEGA